jgi:predicted dehydrogenase
MPAEPVRVAVAGCGWWASQAHLPAVMDCADARLVAVVDPDPRRRAAAVANFSAPTSYSTVNDLLRDQAVEVLVVANPAAAHYESARAAIDHGAHVLVEKPFTLRAQHAWDLVARAERADRLLTVSYPYQHTAAARRIHELLGGAELGELIQISAVFASGAGPLYRGDDSADLGETLTRPLPATYADPLTAGGGQGQTQASHVIGAICHATGDRVETVTAYLSHAGLAVDLAVSAAARLGSGALLSLASAGTLRPGDDAAQTVRYFGAAGYACHDLRRATLTWRAGSGAQHHIKPAPGQEPYPHWAPVRELIALARTPADARTGSDAPGEAAARAVELTECLYLSAKQGVPAQLADLS